MTTKTTTASGRDVTIRTITVGQSFGTAAVVKAANGRVIYETRPVGLGATEVATEIALRWCASH